MNKKTLAVLIMAVLVIGVVAFVAINGGNPDAVMSCADCEGAGCEVCGNTGSVPADTPYYSTWMALLAPVIAIALALVTKEVYSSLIIGILVGGLLATD
ncbi:MAG: Na+/H+ antiporter NhaC family protein, partial [Clostridia bacterium]|nr:Na+/H+ antiporter NhaC family protein [Clostridia bacterium]